MKKQKANNIWELCWQNREFIWYYSSQRHLLLRYFCFRNRFTQSIQEFACVTAKVIMSGLHKGELSGYLFHIYICVYMCVFVSICYCMKELWNRHRKESIWREMSKTPSPKSSLGPEVNKLQTSEKCTTFLQRWAIFGVITVVFVKCAVEGAANQNFFHFSRPFMHEGWHPAALPSLCKLDASDKRLAII